MTAGDRALSVDVVRTIASRSLAVVCILLVGLALLSIAPGDKWFIRLLYLIREPLLYFALGLAFVSASVGKWRWRLMAGFAIVAAIHFVRMWPYFALAPVQVTLADATPDGCFSALSLNVKMTNQEYQKVARIIDRTKPDILLLMEPDAKWAHALAPQLSHYSYRLSKPQDNAYGMEFASNLVVRKAQMVSNTAANTPTLYATIDVRSGAQFEFIGLHPRPPIPGQNTTKRDANIARAAAHGLADALVMGDFNDVPWSRTTTTFREQGGWRDPRIGRGSFPTFPVGYTLVGWPLDQLMVKNKVEAVSFTRMENVGSDHLPVLAHVCIRALPT